MQRLNRGMLRRYDIPEHAPSGVRAVQFGLSEALLGVADRLLDAACPSLGIACLPPDRPWTGAGETVSSVTATGSPLSRTAETAAVFTSPP